MLQFDKLQINWRMSNQIKKWGVVLIKILKQIKTTNAIFSAYKLNKLHYK